MAIKRVDIDRLSDPCVCPYLYLNINHDRLAFSSTILIYFKQFEFEFDQFTYAHVHAAHAY